VCIYARLASVVCNGLSLSADSPFRVPNMTAQNPCERRAIMDPEGLYSAGVDKSESNQTSSLPWMLFEAG